MKTRLLLSFALATVAFAGTKWYMVNIMLRMVSIFAIIGGIKVRSCGINSSSLCRSTVRAFRSSLRVSMPSSVSKTDRTAQQIGMSKQCGSQ